MESRERRGAAGAGAGLLERESELELLAGSVRDVSESDARVIVIDGDAGLGKSSLLECAAELAEGRKVAVLRARGGSLERTLGWGVARQLFEGRVARATAAERRSLLRGSAALAAPLLGFAGKSTAAGGPGEGNDQPGPFKDFHFEHGLYWLVCNLTDRGPLALLIDDAQWCDDATLEWLLYLLRRSERLPLLIVLAKRPGEPGAPKALLDLIGAEPVARTVALPALGVTATVTLLEREFGAPVDHEFGLACHARTRGNPLFVTALAAELAAEGVEPVKSAAVRVRTLTPEGVSRVTMLRLARQTEPALDLARAVAVLDPAAELRYAAELAGLTEDAAVAALDELVEAQVLSVLHPLAFVHPLIGSVVYEDLPRARRAMMHKQAARLLVAADAEPGRVGAHLLRTAPAGDAWVVEKLRAAAAGELERGSPSTAGQLLSRARAEPPRADAVPGVLLELGRAESLSGDLAGVETLGAAIAASTDGRDRGEAAMLLGRLYLGAGDPRAAVAAVQAAADEIGWQDTDLRLRLEAFVVNAARGEIGLLDLIPQRLRMVREHLGEDSDGARLIAAQLSWGLTAIGAPAARAVDFARRALAGGRLIAEVPSAPEAYLGAINMLSLADELGEANERFGQAIALAQRNGSLPAFSAACCFRAYAEYLRGNLEQAELLARDALRASKDSEALLLVAGLASAYLALVLIARGAVEEATTLLAGEPGELEGSSVSWATEGMFVAGCVYVAQGLVGEGVAVLLGCGRRAIAWGVVNPAWLPWRSKAAIALDALGESDQALRLCDEELMLARGFGARRPLGIALRARGLIEGGRPGIDLLRESEAVLAASPARLERAHTLVSLGAALRRANSRAEARTALADGLVLAERCGAVPLANEARAELSATGARPRSVLRTGADSLTASERRVCELAASGKSNPEIAQLLFVTRATVESHLHSAYGRLDIGSRKQLAAALAT